MSKSKNNMSYAEMMKEGRKRLGMSQRDVAEKINVSNSSWARWESGEVIPSNIYHIYQIATVLNLNFYDLISTIIPEAKKEYKSHSHFAKEVRKRRIHKVRETRDSHVAKSIIQVFESILIILDEATQNNDFDGIKIYVGDKIGKRYTMEPYGFCDWFHDSGQLKVKLEEPVDPFDFLMDLKNYINTEKGFHAELRKFAPNVVELYVNIQ